MGRVVHILTASLAIFFAHAQQPGPGISRQLLVWKDSLERPTTEDRVKRELIGRIFDNRDHLWPDTLLPNVLARLSYHAVDLTDDSLFLAINREARFVARAFRDTLALGSTTWDLGWYHEKTLQRDSAYYYFFLAKDLYQAREDLASTASLYRKMASMQNLLKDYAGAEANLVEAIRISEIIGDREGLFRCYQMLGTNLKDQGIYPEALDYFERARGYLQEIDGGPNEWYAFYNNLGNVHRASGNYQLAAEYYRQAIENDSLEYKNPREFSLYKTNLATALYALGRIQEAEKAYLEALAIRQSGGNALDLASSHYFLARLYQGEGRDSLAENHLEQALGYAEASNSPERLLELYPLAAQIVPQEAPYFFQQYAALNQELLENERDERNRFARIRYNTEQYIAQNEALEQQLLLWVGIALGVFLLSAAAVVIILQRIRNQKLRFQQQQQVANQEIFNLMLGQSEKIEQEKQKVQKRISEELHDGVLGELNGIRMVLLGLNGKSDPASLSMRTKAIEKLQGLQEDIRGISHELSNAVYRKIHNFTHSLTELAEEISLGSGVLFNCQYNQDVDWDALPGEVKINLYRVIQESLQNVVKHANASEVTLQMEGDSTHLEIHVRDDGKGFNPRLARKGIGLKNIQSRVRAIGGKLKVSSAPGKGTTLSVLLPWPGANPPAGSHPSWKYRNTETLETG